MVIEFQAGRRRHPVVTISTRMNIRNHFVARLCIHYWEDFTKALFP